MKRIILASGSPRRKKLLKLLGLEFDIVNSNVEEKLNPRLQPKSQPAYLSKIKAEAVAQKLTNAIVIGADSMVLLGDELIGKPKHIEDARKMLRKLSGTTHSIVTGVTIVDSDSTKSITTSTETKVWFRKLSRKEIDSYLKKDEPWDKAGAYAIQGIASIFIRKIEGDYFGAIGLPLFELEKQLRKFGINSL